MQPDRDAAPAATPPGDATRDASVQQALEQFVELHATGQAPDAAAFAARFPEPLRPRVLAQVRQFLAFDGLLGHQEWEPKATKETQGRVFGDFVIHEELGRGGMGIVYLATQKSLHRRVALKVMASGLTLSKRHVERFRREAAAAAQLRHPAIVAVHSLTEVDGTYALAMDYVAGRNLADMLDDLRLANGDGATAVEGTLGIAKEKGWVAECAMFVADLASALAVAHAAQVVHRDLKPRNLMLDERRQVRLLDFGLAKSLGEGSISMSGEITGTVHYMSPEQTLAKRVEVDHRADIWALGVILYEMLTLVRPFDGKNLQQIVYEICFKEPAPLQRHNHKVPRDLATICLKALEKDPQNRYATAAEFEADLRRFLSWEPIHAKPAGPMTRLAKWLRRHRTESALAGALLLAGVGALGMQWQRGRTADALLVRAEQAKDAGRFAEAFALASQALDLRNDEATRARLEAYSEKRLRIETDAGNLALRSKDLVDKDRELALQLALEAEALHSSAETRSAVLHALGGGNAVRTLRPAKSQDGGNQVLANAWSPDGHFTAAGIADGRLVVWDATTGKEQQVLSGHRPGTWVTGLAFVDAERLVSAGVDATLRAFRPADGSTLGHTELPGSVLTMVHAGERALLITYGRGKGPHLAQVWSLRTLQPVSPPVEHGALILAAALSPDGCVAATWSSELGAVRLWRTADGAPLPLAEPTDVQGRVGDLAFRADGTQLAIARLETARVYAVADGALRAEVRHSDAVHCVQFDARGERLITGSADRTARVWRLPAADGTGTAARELAMFAGHAEAVRHVALDPQEQLLLTGTGAPIGGQRGTLNLFDLGGGRAVGGEPVRTHSVGPAIEWAEFAPDGRAVLARASGGRALLWDTARTAGVVTLRQPGIVPAVAFAADGARVVTAGDDQRLRLWSTSDGRLLWTSDKFGDPLRCLDIDARGERIAASTVRGAVFVHRLADGARLFALAGHTGNVPVVRFQRGGDDLLTAGEQDGKGLLQVWNTVDQSRRYAHTFARAITSADVSPDGRLLVTTEADESVARVWSLPDFAPRAVLANHGEALTCVRFSPDGTAVLTASRDRTAVLQDLSGTVRQRFRAEQPLLQAAFSPDGSYVLTGGADSNAEAQLWRTADGTESLHFRGHRGSVHGVAFAADSRLVATSAADGTTCLWPTDPVAVARRLSGGSAPNRDPHQAPLPADARADK